MNDNLNETSVQNVLKMGANSSAENTCLMYPKIFSAYLPNGPKPLEIFKRSLWSVLRISRTTDYERHKSKISETLGRCGRQNMLRPYLKFGIGIEFLAV